MKFYPCKIIEDYNSGLSVEFLYRRYRTSKNKIYKILLNRDIRLRGEDKLIDESILIQLYIIENLSKPEITEKLQISLIQLNRSLNYYKIQKSKEMENMARLKRVKESNLKKYGVEYPLSNKSIQNKAKENNLLKYGYENPFSIPEVKKKIKQTNFEKFGVEYPSQRPEHKEILSDFAKNSLNKNARDNLTKMGKKYIDNFSLYLIDTNQVNELKELPIFIAEKFGTSETTIYRKIKELNTDLYNKVYKNKNSSWEIYFKKILDELGLNYKKNYRKISKGKYEIDFYLQEHKIGFEIDPFYTHSTFTNKSVLTTKTADYHFEKWKYFYEKGITLINIWEIDFKDIAKLKSNILDLLQKKSSLNENSNIYFLGREIIPFNLDLSKVNPIYLMKLKSEWWFSTTLSDTFDFALSTSGYINKT